MDPWTTETRNDEMEPPWNFPRAARQEQSVADAPGRGGLIVIAIVMVQAVAVAPTLVAALLTRVVADVLAAIRQCLPLW